MPPAKTRLFNTLSGKKEPLPKIGRKSLRLFVCGPTVYDLTHIGHARTYIFFDFLAKHLRSAGHKLFYLQNITNVDDKIIDRARREKKDPLKFADALTKSYFKDMKTLGVTAVDTYAPATKFIPQIIRQVQTLIKKGFAYKIEGDGYYYDISKFKDYGKLSRRTVEQAEDGISRIDASVNKRNRGDFCLWKFSPPGGGPGEPSWPSPLGAGRPGWHIEDTAISEHYFGPQYELHGGGLDLKFPHHEAEIAQQEAASSKKPFVKVWMHVGMLTTHGEKMAKSLGNFVTVREFLKDHSPETLRLMVLNHHYRSPLDYAKHIVEDAERTLYGLKSFFAKVDFVSKHNREGTRQVNLKKYAEEFSLALLDDLNTPRALGTLFTALGEANKHLFELSPAALQSLKTFLKDRLEPFGIPLHLPKIPSKIKGLAREREEHRLNKQFIQADRLRKEAAALGYLIEDTPLGPFIVPKRI